MRDMALYYADAQPSQYLLKEILVRHGFQQINKILKHETVDSDLDSYFLRDAAEFLRLSVLNLLAYKFLMLGNYLAWGEVTLYYSNFYSVNCLLRLKGFTVSHLDFLDEGSLIVRIERVDLKNHTYKFSRLRRVPHQYLWNKFSELYPKLGFTPHLGRILVEERIRWNYDLFYPSQSMADYAKKEAKTRWDNNFLSPNYGNYPDPEASEYYHDLMADCGYEEAGSGQLIEICLDHFTEIAKVSKFRSWYTSYFAEISNGIDDFTSHEDMRNEIKRLLLFRIEKLES